MSACAQYGQSAKYTRELAEIIERTLPRRIDEAIAAVGSDRVFVRLSSRSPKDVPLRDRALMARLIREYVDAHRPAGEGHGRPSDALLFQAVVASCSRACLVRTADEAVAMLVRSERVFQDLTARLLHEEAFRMCVVVRAWADLEPEMEFRVFVYNARLTAITQYYRACYVASIGERAAEIEARVSEFVRERVIPAVASLGLPSYVVDVVLGPDGAHVVELNHFHSTTSPGLFDWVADADALRDGERVHFRCLRAAPANALAELHVPLRVIVDELYPPPPPPPASACALQ